MSDKTKIDDLASFPLALHQPQKIFNQYWSILFQIRGLKVVEVFVYN